MTDETESRDPAPLALPAEPEFKRPNLANPVDVRRELVRLYTDLRNGRVSPSVVWASGMLMDKILKAFEVDMVDRRLKILEEKAGIKTPRTARPALRGFQTIDQPVSERKWS